MDNNGQDVLDAEVTSTALVPAPPAGLFRTDDPVQVIEKATRVADALSRVISQKHLFATIQGRDHVMVEGWQLLGGMLGVSAVCTATEPVEGGFKATVEARMADGRVVGRAEALCTRTEKRGPWKTADDYALLSMAQTRATSKALKGPLGFIVSLAGYATTPAEEMPREVETRPASNGKPPSEAEINTIRKKWKDMMASLPAVDDWNRFAAAAWDDVPAGMRESLNKAIDIFARQMGWQWDGSCYIESTATTAPQTSQVPF